MITLKFKPDKKLVSLFSFISAGGYGQSDNFSSNKALGRFFQYLKAHPNSGLIQRIKTYLKQGFGKPDAYRRFINYFLLKPDKKSRELVNEFTKVFKINFYFQNLYLHDLKAYKDAFPVSTKQLVRETLNFLNLKNKAFRDGISITINLFDQANKGSLHKNGNVYIISVSPNINHKISRATVRHELLHYLLKKLVTKNFSKLAFNLPVNKNYQSDPFRTRLDEYIVRAINSYFISKELGQEWLKVVLKKEINDGFTQMGRVYDFIDFTLAQKKQTLNESWYIKLISFLENADFQVLPPHFFKKYKKIMKISYSRKKDLDFYNRRKDFAKTLEYTKKLYS